MDLDEIELSGLMVAPIVKRLRGWVAAGKFAEEDLAGVLGANAQALLEDSMDPPEWTALSEVEGMIEKIASEIGGEAGLAEWAREIFAEWTALPGISALLSSARRLPDAQGFAITQTSALLIRESEWQYEGGAHRFSVEFSGLAEASHGLKSLFGGLLSASAEAASSSPFDVRVQGIDGEELVIFGELEGDSDQAAESRLHQAALIP